MKHCKNCQYWEKENEDVNNSAGYCFREPKPIYRRGDTPACRLLASAEVENEN